MRIAIATTTGFHLRHLARELILMGHDVSFISYLPYFRTRREGIPTTNAHSLFWRLQPWVFGTRFPYSHFVRQRCVESLLELTDSHVSRILPRCDVFIGLSGMAVQSADVARRKYGARVIIDRGSRHVLSQNELISTPGRPSLTHLYIDRETSSYAIADCIALPSEHAVRSFVTRGFSEQQLFRNHYGVDFTLFTPTRTPDGPLKLLFVGAWSYQKGVDILSSALEQLPECTLTHAGRQVNVSYPLTTRFRVLGHVPARHLPAVLANHHILVLPSRQDGFGMVLLEALAAGLGVVASHMTGGPDIQQLITRKEHVSLISPGSVEELVHGIRSVAKALPPPRAVRSSLSDSEREYFSWKAYAKRYVECIQQSYS